MNDVLLVLYGWNGLDGVRRSVPLLSRGSRTFSLEGARIDDGGSFPPQALF